MDLSGLWSAMTVIGPIMIAGGLVYGIWRASSRRKLTEQERRAGDAKTREMYRGSDNADS